MTRIRSPAPIAAGLAALAFVIGGAIALAQSPPHRATTTLVVEVHGVPAAPTAGDAVPTIAALVVSDLVVGNVATAMQLDAPVVRSHLHASVVPHTALIRIRYDNASAVRAQQIAQEASSALQAVVAARFGSRLTVAVIDPLRSSRLGRPWLRAILLAVLAGTLAGFACEAALSFRRRRVPTAPGSSTAPRPVKGAARAKPVPEPPPSPPRVVRPVPKPVPAPTPAPEPAARVVELRRLLAARREEFDPDQVLQWEAYLDALEAQSVDGKLPPALESLALGIFEPLLEPAR